MEREPFAMAARQDSDGGVYELVPDWTARERIAVECFKALICAVRGEVNPDYPRYAKEAFKAADALIAAAKEHP
jgi:hypothetical protein